jgi:hypothetical protein
MASADLRYIRKSLALPHDLALRLALGDLWTSTWILVGFEFRLKALVRRSDDDCERQWYELKLWGYFGYIARIAGWNPWAAALCRWFSGVPRVCIGQLLLLNSRIEVWTEAWSLWWFGPTGAARPQAPELATTVIIRPRRPCPSFRLVFRVPLCEPTYLWIRSTSASIYKRL